MKQAYLTVHQAGSRPKTMQSPTLARSYYQGQFKHLAYQAIAY